MSQIKDSSSSSSSVGGGNNSNNEIVPMDTSSSGQSGVGPSVSSSIIAITTSTLSTVTTMTVAKYVLSNAPLDEVWTRKSLQALVKRIDPNEQLDEDVEDFILNYAEEYMESLIEGAAVLATHRNSLAVDVKDVQTHLERTQNIWIPGFGSEELRPYKRAALTEAHKQRTAIIKKSLKKY